MVVSSLSQSANILHAPVIHRGYLDYLNEYPADRIFLVGKSILDLLPDLRKDIRALNPEVTAFILESSGVCDNIDILERSTNTSNIQRVVMPDEEISELIKNEVLGPNVDVALVPFFLRWDRKRTFTEQQVIPDRIVNETQLPAEIFQLLRTETERGSDWWRRVAAVVETEEGDYISARNRHLPTDFSTELDGDPRMHGKRGSARGATTAIHAEAAAIAQCARSGNSLENAKMYVSTYPCPTCAKLIAQSGFEELYFVEGYSMVDGQRVLKDAGIEIIKIDTSLETRANTRDYPEKRA